MSVRDRRFTAVTQTTTACSSSPMQSGILGFLFLGQVPPTCLDAADADGNNQLQLTDAVRILGYLFLGQAAPVSPGPPGNNNPCGPDNDATHLGCETYTKCE